MYPIGRFAKLTRVTAKALQIYERHGLLRPRRTRAGYRRYTMREVQQLEHVLALRALGLSLKQVRVLTADTARLAEVLTQQRAALEEKRERIDRAVEAIDTIARDDYSGAALDRFFVEANWERWEAKRRAADRALARADRRGGRRRREDCGVQEDGVGRAPSLARRDAALRRVALRRGAGGVGTRRRFHRARRRSPDPPR